MKGAAARGGRVGSGGVTAQARPRRVFEAGASAGLALLSVEIDIARSVRGGRRGRGITSRRSGVSNCRASARAFCLTVVARLGGGVRARAHSYGGEPDDLVGRAARGPGLRPAAVARGLPIEGAAAPSRITGSRRGSSPLLLVVGRALRASGAILQKPNCGLARRLGPVSSAPGRTKGVARARAFGAVGTRLGGAPAPVRACGAVVFLRHAAPRALRRSPALATASRGLSRAPSVARVLARLALHVGGVGVGVSEADSICGGGSVI